MNDRPEVRHGSQDPPIWSLSLVGLTTLANAIATTPADALPYGPDTCIQGYVWREARASDTVCVTPEVRARTAQENETAAEWRVR